MIDRVCKKTGSVKTFGIAEVVFRNKVSWSQSSVFRYLKMWYDVIVSTAWLDRFSTSALKLTLGL